MIPADSPAKRLDAKLLVVDGKGRIHHALRSELVDLLCPGDLLIANDAATLPASLHGEHVPTGARIEVRLAGRRSLAPEAIDRFDALVFGAGDFRTRTEDRPAPPALAPGDRLALGRLSAVVQALLDHPWLVSLWLEGPADIVWAQLARHGRPIQYAHVSAPLALWDVWTPIAAMPVAFEAPSASYALDWRLLGEMRNRGIAFASLTHAAGISSTGDDALDRRLPLDEPYRIPATTARAIRHARLGRGRIIAVGTTVLRALEDAATPDGSIREGEGLATGRIDAASQLRVVDALLTGTHEPGSSHYELLRAFADDALLSRASEELEAGGYRTHEFGDSMFIACQQNSGK
jgi:S-adenosylmethionine:tRNA ribosyltransferase-isomerase